MIFFPLSVLKSCFFPYFSGREIFGLESPHSTEWTPLSFRTTAFTIRTPCIFVRWMIPPKLTHRLVKV